MLRPSELMLLGMILVTNQALAQESRNYPTIEDWAKAFDRYAQDAIGSTDAADKERALIRYFQIFPSDFKSFQQIFGYLWDERGRILAKPPIKHTLYGFLRELKSVVPAKEYYEKMLGVGVGGVWDADEVNYLQFHLREMVVENAQLGLEVLSKKEEKEIRSFWRFLFDGPHPEHRLNRKYYEELYSKARGLNPKIAEQLKLAYEQLLSEQDGH